MIFIWTSDLDTGIEIIDEQHKRIVDYINMLESARRKKDRQAVAHVLDELVDYTCSHFAFEESLQVEAGYIYATPHKAVHAIFIKRIASYQEKHNAGEDVAEKLLAMLGTWLVHHIKRDDMAYVAEIKNQIDVIVQDKEQAGWLSRSLGMFFK